MNQVNVSKKSVKILIFVTMLIAFASTFLVYKSIIYYEIVVPSAELCEDGEINYYIDSVTYKDHYIQIEGWAGKTDEDIALFDTSVLLKKEESSEYYLLSTEMQERSDLQDIKGCDYTRGGFIAAIKTNALKAGESYKVYILYENDDNQLLVETSTCVEVE